MVLCRVSSSRLRLGYNLPLRVSNAFNIVRFGMSYRIGQGLPEVITNGIITAKSFFSQGISCSHPEGIGLNSPAPIRQVALRADYARFKT